MYTRKLSRPVQRDAAHKSEDRKPEICYATPATHLTDVVPFIIKRTLSKPSPMSAGVQGDAAPAAMARSSTGVVGRGQNGVSTNGVAANFSCFDGGTFWILPLTCFYIPKSVPGRTFSPICQS